MKKGIFFLITSCLFISMSVSAQKNINGVSYSILNEQTQVGTVEDNFVAEITPYIVSAENDFNMQENEVLLMITVSGHRNIIGQRTTYLMSPMSYKGQLQSLTLQGEETSFDGQKIYENFSSFDADINSEGETYVVTTTADIKANYWNAFDLAASLEPDFYFKKSGITDKSADIVGKKFTEQLGYYKKDGEYYPIIYSYVISDDDDVPSIDYIDCKDVYEVSTITSDFLSGNKTVTSLTIPKTVTDIRSNAFDNCVISLYNVADDNPNYCTLCDGKVLCRKENGVPVEVLMVAKDAALKNKRLDLPASVKKIADNALTNVYDEVTFYTPLYVDYEGPKYNDKGQKIVHFDHPSISYENKNIQGDIQSYVALSSKGNNAFYFTNANAAADVITPTALQNDFLSTIAGYKGVCYLDLTSCTPGQDVNDITFSNVDMSVVNHNCLLFLPKGATSNATNVVCEQEDGTFVCENLSITRANGEPFYTPYPFTAKNVTIDYQINANLAGLVLPFDYTNDNVYLATFGGVEGDKINLDVKTTIPANTPFIAQLKSDGTQSNISATNVVVEPTVVNVPASSQGWTLSGSYRTVTNSGTANIYGFSKNQLKKVEGATFKPFSAFFVQNGTSLANLRFSSLEDATGVENLNSNELSVLVSGTTIIMNGNGQNVSVVSVNGSTIYNAAVNGSVSVDVTPGVYVVNGTKVVVNN